MKLSVALLALAASLDGFGTGMAYGLRRIRVSWAALALIAACSGAAVWASMTLGGFAVRFFPPEAARRAGALMLVAVGGWALAHQIGRGRRAEERPTDEAAGQRAKGVSRLLRILKSPPLADFDRSGAISAGEAVWLGSALSLDAFGAGFGAAWLGLPAAPTALASAVASAVLLFAGLKAGGVLSGIRSVRRLSVLPGCLLVLMGVWKWFGAG
ncbi:MAG: sporulation membrane protein YtaF [Candidatus Reconcilbacillus cellulovorans]|uniref:Sporulation membrane protein YtaF n=1 Tax=Candidatus Reconcilbacillus cellulovorans TaxID=1906605 RepID=A0A2A6DWL7_9BACL|nr:MAG: sporulation membrane protein YtaF [Candidatus Reconcilbacillus cellulovorans]